MSSFRVNRDHQDMGMALLNGSYTPRNGWLVDTIRVATFVWVHWYPIPEAPPTRLVLKAKGPLKQIHESYTKYLA